MTPLIEATREIKNTASMSAIAERARLNLVRTGREWKACCPFHADRSPSFTVYADDRRWHCFGCGAGGDQVDFIKRFYRVPHRDAVQMVGGDNLPDVVREQPELGRQEAERDTTAEAIAIWRQAGPVAGTEAEAYLRWRGLTCPIPESLRFARLRYGRRGRVHPCLVALVASVENKATGVQRTFLRSDGLGKADVPKPKLSLGHITGGAIRLASAAAEMVVCEGMEDALTLQQELGRSAWASAGAGNLAKLRLPVGVRSVIIGADADETGQDQARRAAKAFAEQGRQTRIINPLPGFKDFNEEIRSVAA